MTQALAQTLKTELLELHRKARETAAAIIELRKKESELNDELRRQASAANRLLESLLGETLQAHGLTWCTMCQSRVASSGATLVFISGCRERDGQAGSFGYEDFDELHSLCEHCREQAFDRHGTIGAYDVKSCRQTKCYAFCVERRDDGFCYARQFGTWKRVLEMDAVLQKMPTTVEQQTIREYDLPSWIRVEVGHGGRLGIVFSPEPVPTSKQALPPAAAPSAGCIPQSSY